MHAGHSPTSTVSGYILYLASHWHKFSCVHQDNMGGKSTLECFCSTMQTK